MIKLLSGLMLVLSSISTANNYNEFSDFFNSFERLSADFEQTTYSDKGVLLTRSSGYFLFKRPQQLLWHIHIPNKQTLLFNDNALWFVDFDLEQASVQPIANLEKTPLYWLFNQPSAKVSLPQYTHTKNGISWYKAQKVNQLIFGFKNNLLHTLSFNNELGQKILILFSAVSVNPNIKLNAFELNIDTTFDVIK